MTPTRFDPDDSRRRRVRCFARWLHAVWTSPAATRESILALSRRIARNGMTPAESAAALDALDALLAEALGPEPDAPPTTDEGRPPT